MRNKHGNTGTSPSHAEAILLKRQDRLLFEFIVLLDFAVDELGGEVLDGAVELVFPEAPICVSHSIGRPASILHSMRCL